MRFFGNTAKTEPERARRPAPNPVRPRRARRLPPVPTEAPVPAPAPSTAEPDRTSRKMLARAMSEHQQMMARRNTLCEELQHIQIAIRDTELTAASLQAQIEVLRPPEQRHDITPPPQHEYSQTPSAQHEFDR